MAVGPGCQALYHYRPIEVMVLDAETKKPIAGADVRLWYPHTNPSVAPWESVGKTGDDGVAQLRAAPFGDAGIMVNATAAGYQPEELSMPAEAVEQMPGSRLPWAVEPSSAPFVLEIYAQPAVRVELVLPNGYIGLVVAEVRIREDSPCTPGQRLFRYDVPATGVVEVTGPPLLRRVYPPDFRARFADGTPVSPQAGPQEVGLRPLKREGTAEYFVVGTQIQFDNIRRCLRKPAATAEGQISDGGKGRQKRRDEPAPAPRAAPPHDAP
jgi:hypothetical protein